MENLKASELLDILLQFKKNKPKLFEKATIYLGDDEELNGVHECYFAQLIDNELEEYYEIPKNHILLS